MDPEYIWIPLPSILAEEQARADAIRRENELQNLRSEKLAAAIREMNSRITEETRRKKQELIDQFLEDTAGYLRSLIVDACQDVMDSMKKNGRLVGKASQRLTNLIETINTLNFLDDQDVNQAIDAIRAQLSIAPGQRRPEDIQRTLADVRVVMLGELYQLTRESNRAGLSSPPPSPQDFRRARRNLNLSTPIAGEDLTRRPRAFQEALL